jgi:uncharacterized protein YndB with AHSA1/START domain
MSNSTTITAQPGEQVVDIERVLDAPIADVYRAYTQPDLIAQWLGPRGYEMEVGKFDLRNGGEWAYVHTSPDGGVFGFHGCFHSVQPHERIIQTFEYEGGKTRVFGHAVYQSVEDRDAMVASGMAQGVTEGFERLDELLA